MRKTKDIEGFLKAAFSFPGESYDLLREGFDNLSEVEIKDLENGDQILLCAPFHKGMLNPRVHKEFMLVLDKILEKSDSPRRLRLCKAEEGGKAVILAAIFLERKR